MAFEQPDFDVGGQVALVTGASHGIGRDLAQALSAAGARVAVLARSRPELAALVDELPHEGLVAVADLTDLDAVRSAIARVEEHFGRIDILVNNAGLGTNHDALEATEAEWDELFAVNVRGLFFLTQAVAWGMVERGYGRIVNLSSQAGLVGIPRHAAYSASKGAVIALTRVLALEWAEHGVTVNSVAPTFVHTPGTAERLDRPEFRAEVLRRIPVGDVGSTTDVAAAVLYLASPAARLVTGATLPVDGGWTAR